LCPKIIGGGGVWKWAVGWGIGQSCPDRSPRRGARDGPSRGCRRSEVPSGAGVGSTPRWGRANPKKSRAGAGAARSTQGTHCPDQYGGGGGGGHGDREAGGVRGERDRARESGVKAARSSGAGGGGAERAVANVANGPASGLSTRSTASEPKIDSPVNGTPLCAHSERTARR
jgi:hypothetical protein